MRRLLLDLLSPTSCTVCNIEGKYLCCDHKTIATRRSFDCIICLCNLGQDGYLCSGCAERTEIDNAFYLAEYKEEIKNIVYKMKFARDMYLCRYMGGLMADVLIDFSTYDLITYVPTSNKRRRIRGFDQSEELCKGLSGAIKTPVRKCLLRDLDERMTHKSISQRAKLSERLFRLNSKTDLKNKNILLVDDVVTTGGTILAAAKLLKSGGARSVDVLALARTK